MLGSGTVDDRVLAASALGWIGDDDAVPALAEAISPEYWEVSLEAVRALAHYPSPEASEAIRAASAHWFWLVRETAAKSSGDSAPQPHSVAAVDASERDRESLLVGSLCSAVPTEVVRGGKKLALDGGHGHVMPDRSELLRDGTALGLVQVRDKLYAITASLHADVFGLERNGSQWILRHVVQLPGYPTGWAVDADGALVFATTRGTATLMPDGALTSEPCPSASAPR